AVCSEAECVLRGRVCPQRQRLKLRVCSVLYSGCVF
ncbi:hypothetical protein A2U01_0060953, partial [Trifolium medium]|nr:hypothetical protein [Trifolium medium]